MPLLHIAGWRIAVAFGVGPEIFGELHLGAIQFRICAGGIGQQVLVLAGFDNAAVFQNDQPIGLAERAQAVGDGNRRAAADEVVERFLNLPLGLRVDR